MTSIGNITLDLAGAVTKPSSMPLALGGQNIIPGYTKLGKNLLVSMAYMPSQRGVMFANGVDSIKHYVGGTVYRTGLLAPSVAPVAALTGTKATTVFETNTGSAYAIAPEDNINLIRNTGAYILANKIVFVNTRSWAGTRNEVYYDGTTTASALAQLKKFINQTGVEGEDYYTYYDFSDEIVATTITSNEKLQIEAVEYGTAGNGYVCVYSGGAGPRFETVGNVAQTVFSGGGASPTTTPNPGTYMYGYTYVRSADGAESGMSPTVEVNNGGGGQVDLTVTVPFDDTSIDQIRIYRTVSGGGLFYRVAEISSASTTYSDTKADTAIIGFDAIPYDASLFRVYRASFPTRVRYLAQFQGRWFGAGALLSASRSVGTATVTKDSSVVTMSKGVNSNWVGRTFQVSGKTAIYSIVECRESLGKIYIDRPYEDTGGIANYTIKDARDPYELFWSEPGLPNNWIGSLKGPSSPDGYGCTGLFAAFGSLIYFTKQSVWRISGNDGVYNVSLISDKCGCVSGQSIVMDGQVLYWVGQDGVYGWSGGGEPINLSTPPQQEIATRGQDATISRITLSHAHRIFGIMDQSKREIRWYMPLDGERYNRYALVLDVQNSVFSLDTCEDVTCSSMVQGHDGEDHVLVGDITGAIYEYGVSTSDVVYGVEQVNTVSSSTNRTVTVSGTPFSTSNNGYWGAPVWHLSSTGEFTRNCIETNTNNTITYRRFMAAPSASTQFVMGGILMWIQTGRFDFGDRYRQKIVPAYIVSHVPESDGQYFFFYSYDQSAWTIPTLGWTAGDLTVGNTPDDFGPRRRYRARKQAVLHGYGLLCVEPGCQAQFSGITIEVRGPSNLEV